MQLIKHRKIPKNNLNKNELVSKNDRKNLDFNSIQKKLKKQKFKTRN